MKAILVIDVNNIDQVNRCYVTVCEDKAQYMIDNVKIKPMPQKMKEDYILFGDEVVWQKAVGYNKCVDEILGEEE